MSSQYSSEEEVLFEEEEVLWAKIRGYPWWPAFVDIVHDPIQDEQAQYTVFFFGDNTQYCNISRLGASKLRKFIEHYAQCYQKAKTQRKLMMSILKAEEKLKQNGQNVEIFQNIRNQLKSKRGRAANKTDSKISSQDHANNIAPELPDLKKHKTQGRPRNKSEEKIDSIQESSKKNTKRLRSDSKKHEVNQHSEQKQDNEEQKPKFIPKTRVTRNQGKKQEIYEQKSISSEQKCIKNEQKSPNRRNRRISAEKPRDMSSQSQREDGSEQKVSQIHAKPLKKQIPKKKIDPRVPGVIRKRGRPKKIIVEQPEQDQSQNSEKRPANIKHFKKKLIQKQKISYQDEMNDHKLKKKQNPQKYFEKNEKYSKKLTENDSQIIERIKFCLTNRDQLIEYLSTIQITTDNVKEILDLNVSQILQEEGQCTPEIIELLELLKATLLYKYFPDDIQIRKKYEKIMKKRQSLMKNHEQSEEQIEYNGQQLLIRKKTSLKLEKFLKEDPNVGEKAKEMAVKIESYFRKADQGIGRKYKALAYKVLRNLKDKTERFKDVLTKLENNEYENELDLQ